MVIFDNGRHHIYTPPMTKPRRRQIRSSPTSIEPVPHEPESTVGILEPVENFLDAHHPANDTYIKAVEHVERQLVHASSLLRPKQVRMMKSVFTGMNYTETARFHGASAQHVSQTARSPYGARLLKLLQYHLQLLEGANLGQRRSMLWRIAQDNELLQPKTSIAAVESLNKMTFKEWEQKNPQNNNNNQGSTTIIIGDSMPRTVLDG